MKARAIRGMVQTLKFLDLCNKELDQPIDGPIFAAIFKVSIDQNFLTPTNFHFVALGWLVSGAYLSGQI